jgi:sodium-dependent dicarboxylate transporter 2/3/5
MGAEEWHVRFLDEECDGRASLCGNEPTGNAMRGRDAEEIGPQWGRWAGLIVFLVVWFSPTPDGLPVAAHRLAAVAMLMAAWWVTSAWPVAVTSLLPVVLFPALGIQSAKGVSTAYFSDSSFLYLGGFVIALGVEKWGLHRRIALTTISLLGSSPKRIVLGFLVATFTLSMWMSNTASTLVMLPIAMSLLESLKEISGDRPEDERQLRKLATAVLLGIAYAASLGGLTTLVGTPTNIVFGDLFQKSFPEAPRISAGEWMLVWAPFGLAFLLFCWLLLSWGLKPSQGVGRLEGAFFRERLKELGPMRRGERAMAAVFATTALLWMLRIDFRVSDSFQIHGWGDWVVEGLKHQGVAAKPGELTDWVSDATVGMAMALLMFFIPVPTEEGRRKPLMDWQTASKLPWDILLLFGGGFALADAFRTTGLAEWAGETFARHSAQQPAWALVTAVCLILVFMTEFTTNVATVNAVLPILATASLGLGVDPRLLMIPATISASCGFMLPVGTPPNAIVFGTGKVTAGQMARYGLVMNLAGVLLTVLTTLYLLAPQQGIDVARPPDWAKASSPAK